MNGRAERGGTVLKQLKDQCCRHSRLLAALVFLAAALLGLALVGSSGIGVDEKTERRTLDVNIRAYVELFTGEDSPEAQAISEHHIAEWRDRDYGQAKFYPVWPVMHAMEQDGNYAGMENVYHYYMYLLFVLGSFAVYSIVRRLTKSRGWGLVTAGLLFVNPRFFTEAFYNNKDIVLLSLCLIVFWLGLVFIQEDSWHSAILFGFAGAVAANSRILGLAAFGLCGIAYLVVRIGNKAWNKRAFWRGFAAVAAFVLFFILLTPACWSGFFSFWKYLIVGTANFDAQRWNGWLLYRDAMYNPVENPVPWHYIPWLMVITTPLLILGLAALWPVLLILRCRADAKKWLRTETVFGLALAVFTAAPVVYAMLARPNLYNGWRHFYFVYGPVVILAGLAAAWLWQSRRVWLRRVLGAVLAVHLVFYAGYICMYYPHSYAYFNFLAGPHPELSYDADYWNISQRELMMEMLDRDPEFSVVCRQPSSMLAWNWYMIKDTVPERFTDKNEEVSWERRNRAKYVLENTSALQSSRMHAGDEVNDPAWQEWEAQMAAQEPVMQIRCGRTVLWRVYENPQCTRE